jgi:excisionase family DNA binding protein
VPKTCRTLRALAVPERRYLRYPEAAAYINGTEWFVRTLVWTGKLHRAKIGKAHVIDKADLDAYMEQAKASS